jgi:hypothetical protein
MTQVSQTVVDKTRTVFGKHRSGYIFPMLLSVQQDESGFVGIMQRLYPEQQFIMFYSQSLHVAGATEESLSMLGVCMSVRVLRELTCMVCVCVCPRYMVRLKPATLRTVILSWIATFLGTFWSTAFIQRWRKEAWCNKRFVWLRLNLTHGGNCEDP